MPGPVIALAVVVAAVTLAVVGGGEGDGPLPEAAPERLQVSRTAVGSDPGFGGRRPAAPATRRRAARRMTDVDVGAGDRLALTALVQHRMTTTEQTHLVIAPGGADRADEATAGQALVVRGTGSAGAVGLGQGPTRRARQTIAAARPGCSAPTVPCRGGRLAVHGRGWA
ncbi:hypothetical protein [Streptomyces sp. ALI-76-A]|uniref:hypothetical protein n=1 Tax=Streptomyces sp. ALI-76-A TaxID=3025736 RepID=UPI00256F0F99|nr:hypothetical protein [Streptomyces sp. ALI-76-A]MDL5198952.1 hypothetical protein [Streptomyces sp. ALI-76-A]